MKRPPSRKWFWTHLGAVARTSILIFTQDERAVPSIDTEDFCLACRSWIRRSPLETPFSQDGLERGAPELHLGERISKSDPRSLATSLFNRGTEIIGYGIFPSMYVPKDRHHSPATASVIICWVVYLCCGSRKRSSPTSPVIPHPESPSTSSASGIPFLSFLGFIARRVENGRYDVISPARGINPCRR